jgi:hypothetical protein
LIWFVETLFPSRYNYQFIKQFLLLFDVNSRYSNKYHLLIVATDRPS